MTNIDTLIHLGAGRCHELEAHLARQPSRLILVEADPRLADELRARTAKLDHVSVHGQAVAAQPGTLTFHRYNLPDAGSLYPATQLQALFPGLKLQQTLTLEAVSPCGLIESLQLQSEADHALIIDLPGEELAVLHALHACGQLHVFRHLHLYCGHESLYASGEAASTILDWLSDQGFDVVECDDSHDPDRPCWTLKRSPLKLECLALQARVEQLTLANADLENKNSALIQGHTDFRKARDEQAQLAAERQTQLETLKAEQDALAKEQATLQAARDEQAKLAAERQKQLDAIKAKQDALVKEQTVLKSAHDEHAKLAAERAEQLKQQTQARDQAQAKLDELTKTLEQRTQAHKNAQSKVDELSKALEAAKAEADKQTTLATQYKREAETQAKLAAERAEQIERNAQAHAALQRDNAIALRMQASRDADLKDLQQRHAEVVEQKDKQAILLKQLTERLTVASNYLHQIESGGNGAGTQREPRAAVTAQDPASPATPATDDHHSAHIATNTVAASATTAGAVESGQPQ